MRDGLPKGWAITPLSEITQINPRHPKELDDSMPVAFAPMAAISESKPEFQFLEERPLGKVRKGFTHFAEGDVLFAKITPCMENGKGAVAVSLRNGLGCGTTELHVLRPQEQVDPYYLYRFLAQPSIRQMAKEKFTGTAGQARVPTSFIEQLEIPLPPLPEQRRIVAKLEKLLAKGDVCQQRLERIPVLLKRFRQSILAAACSGRLTVDWRKRAGIENKRPVPTANTYLPEIPDSWRWVKLAETGEMSRGRSRHRPRNEPKLFDGHYPFIQTGDIAQSGGRITSHRQTYSEAGLSQSRLWPGGTICITIAANIAESALLTYPACFPDSVVGIIANPGVCVAEYVEYFIRVAKVDLATFAPATAQKNINIAILNEVAVPLPPLAEQKEIVRQVEALFALADQIEARCARAKAQTDNLTQSILAKAFRGELFSQQEGTGYVSDPTMQKLSQYLVYLRKNEAVLFIGAGISRIAGCAGAKELCRALQEKMMELKKQQRLFGDAVSPRYIHSFSESNLPEQEYEAILDENLTPDPAKFSERYLPFMKILTRCHPLPPIMTINIDPCLKLTKLFEMRKIYSKTADMCLDNFKNGTIFHLHGYRDGAGPIVLNTIEHKERWEQSLFKRFIVDVFKNYSVLFLGCSLEDNAELLAHIELAKKESGSSSKVHFALIPSDDPVAIPDEIFGQIHGIQIIKYGTRDKFVGILGDWIELNFPRRVSTSTGTGDKMPSDDT